jgi:glutamine amidotransferase-like uncharacterized protein
MIRSRSNEVALARIATPHRVLVVACLVLISTAFAACNKGNTQLKGGSVAPILLFSGTGTSPNDVEAFEDILKRNRLNYSTVNSSQLNKMRESQLREYRLLIIPGGNFIEMGNGLSSNTAANIHNAVQNGLNYLGVCGGGFLAGNSSYYNGLNLTSGAKFGFYSAENLGIRKAAVPIAVAGGPTLDQYWEDGPQFTGWGSVVGKYPDGTPAIVEGPFGSGWVILSGVHPEAPEKWRRGMNFHTPASADNAYAEKLIQTALNRTSLLHY